MSVASCRKIRTEHISRERLSSRHIPSPPAEHRQQYASYSWRDSCHYLSDPLPDIPLNSIVIYDGAFAQGNASLTMTQKVQGFYQAGNSPVSPNSPVSRLTHIVGSGKSNKFETISLGTTDSLGTTKYTSLPSLYGNGSQPPFPGWYGTWDNPTWTFPYPTIPVPQIIRQIHCGRRRFGNNPGRAGPQQPGCVSWGAVIVSTTVKNSDGDGLLDVWKKPLNFPDTPGYCDVAVNSGTCNGPTDPSWVSLPTPQIPKSGA